MLLGLRAMRKAMGLFAVVGLGALGLGCGVLPEGPEVCPAVVVSARPPEGGDCRNFGDPCQVPDGYVYCCNVENEFCSGNERCVDDPKDTCDPSVGEIKCQGICQAR